MTSVHDEPSTGNLTENYGLDLCPFSRNPFPNSVPQTPNSKPFPHFLLESPGQVQGTLLAKQHKDHRTAAPESRVAGRLSVPRAISRLPATAFGVIVALFQEALKSPCMQTPSQEFCASTTWSPTLNLKSRYGSSNCQCWHEHHKQACACIYVSMTAALAVQDLEQPWQHGW